MSFKNNRHCAPNHMRSRSKGENGKQKRGKGGKWERDTEEMGGTTLERIYSVEFI